VAAEQGGIALEVASNHGFVLLQRAVLGHANPGIGMCKHQYRADHKAVQVPKQLTVGRRVLALTIVDASLHMEALLYQIVAGADPKGTRGMRNRQRKHCSEDLLHRILHLIHGLQGCC